MIIFLALFLGLIPAMIARLKGRSFFGWWVYGFLVFIIALPHSIFAARMKVCPQCKEKARHNANLCPHCGSSFIADNMLASE